jgi:putative oxidoreductase
MLAGLLRLLDSFQPVALLVLRLALGSVVITAGYPKIFHGGAVRLSEVVAGWGWPAWLAYVAAASEFFGGILLGLGLLTRPAALFVMVTMAVAAWKVHLPSGLLGPQGYALPMTLAAVAFALIAFGPGKASADYLIFGHGPRRK